MEALEPLEQRQRTSTLKRKTTIGLPVVNPTAPLKLTDESGADLQLNAGKMWIGFVPESNSGSTAIA